MKSKKIIRLLGFVCVLAFAVSISSTLVAGEKGGFKNHDGIWIAPGQPGGPKTYLTCSSTGNSSSRSYTCTGSLFSPDGTVIPMFWDGFFTGSDTYRERGIGYINNGGTGFILVQIVAGRLGDDDTSEANGFVNIYMDFDGDGLPSDGELIIPGTPESGMIYRMVSVFPDIRFPDYPPKP